MVNADLSVTDIQLEIMNELRINEDIAADYKIIGTHQTKQQYGLFYTISMPNQKLIYRKVEHFQKLRQLLMKKWPGFVPLPQINLQILGKNNLNTELQGYLLNCFIKDLVQHEFFHDSNEFNTWFDPNQEYYPLVSMDETLKMMNQDMKKDTFLKEMLARYQKIYPIDLSTVSTAHTQMCRDFITRF